MSEAQKQFFRVRLARVEKILQARSRQTAAEITNTAAGADSVDRASAEDEY